MITNLYWLVHSAGYERCTVGADVAGMTHTARLGSTNMLVEVQLVESLAIAAISGFAEQLLNVSCCFSPVISYAA